MGRPIFHAGHQPAGAAMLETPADDRLAGRFETEILTTRKNLKSLLDVPGK
ncbi:MAG: hypothetical protein KAY37_03110 [Phycisphaerae bacterium]|nr:hypothetical protein [Phycisphaerae bacterium]